MQILSATRPVRKRPRPLARCKGGQDKQTPACTAGVIADGFLKHRFLPVYEISADLPEQQKVEAVYLKSVKHLTAYYKIETIDMHEYPYPYNVLLSHWDISRKMKTKGRYREIRITETDDLTIQLSVTESVNTGNTLFYIPLVPLFKSLQRENNSCALFLMGVCVYLYRKAGVCHYKDDESYLCYIYDIMNNWIEDDRDSMDDIDYEKQRAILDEVFAVGDEVEKLLFDESYLIKLQSRLQEFRPDSQFEKACVTLAKETLAVWMEFPTSNLYQNITTDDEDDDYYNNGKIKVTDYISFIGETASCVYDSMMNMLNDDFNERSGIQDFEYTIVFNKPQSKYDDVLAYEQRVIAIIEELCDLIPELI